MNEPGNVEGKNQGPEIPSTPKADDKTTGGRGMMPPMLPGGYPSPLMQVPGVPDSPAGFSGDPLKEGANARIEDEVNPELEKGNYAEALRKLDPTMSGEKADAFGYAINIIKRGESISDDDRQGMVTRWKNSGTFQEEAKGFIERSDLPPGDKTDLIDKIEKQLSQMSQSQKDEELPKNEQEQIFANGKAMDEQIVKESADIDAKLTEAKNEPEKHKHEIERFERIRDRMHEWRKKMDEFLHPDEGAKAWLKRGGKLTYYILLTAFIAFLATMNAVHNMAGSQGGSRR